MNTASTVLINYSDKPVKCHVKLRAAGGEGKYLLEDFSGVEVLFSEQMQQQGFSVELKPFESKVFSYDI